MRMKLPEGYEKLNAYDKNNFKHMWFALNRQNMNICVMGKVFGEQKKEDAAENSSANIVAYDKNTCEKLVTIPIRKDEVGHYKIYEDNFKTREFDMRFTGKPGEVMWLLYPEMSIDIDNNGSLKMHMNSEDCIREVVITGISGASDISKTLSYYEKNDEEMKEGSIVQEAFFETYDEALNAIDLLPNYIDSWDEYIEYMKDIIRYRYKIDMNINLGDTAYIMDEKATEVLNSDEYSRDTRDYLTKSKFVRAILSNLDYSLEVQTLGELYDMQSGKLIKPRNECIDVINEKPDKCVISWIGHLDSIPSARIAPLVAVKKIENWELVEI